MNRVALSRSLMALGAVVLKASVENWKFQIGEAV